MAAGYVDDHKLILYRDGAQPRDITAFASDMTLTDDLDTLAAELTFKTFISPWDKYTPKLALAPGDPEAIRARMEACARARREKQPLNLPSAGSTFKRPEGHFAAKLIDDCGLRGLTVGGAQVSEKHAGFVVNIGGATARDMLELMRQIEQRVFEQTGVQLEPEVRILGADEQKKEESV